jgi:hypothetical protein
MKTFDVRRGLPNYQLPSSVGTLKGVSVLKQLSRGRELLQFLFVNVVILVPLGIKFDILFCRDTFQ